VFISIYAVEVRYTARWKPPRASHKTPPPPRFTFIVELLKEVIQGEIEQLRLSWGWYLPFY
jgi:hypothetical protein